MSTEALARALRAEFLRLLTQDGPTKDHRRKDFNQAIFDAEKGYAIWTGTDLGMVMEKFDAALRAALAPLDVEEPTREWLIAHWVGHRCPMVGCPTTEYHDHGSGHATREMTPEEREARP